MVYKKIGDKNVSDSVIKDIKGIFNTFSLPKTKKQKRIYKKLGKEFIPGLVGIYIWNDLILSVITHFILPTTVEFRAKLGFKQLYIIMSKKQSVLTKVIKLFAREKILHYKIDLYFLRIN